MQVGILNGIFADEVPDFRASYPVNMVPVPKEQGISKGYLKPADGIVANGTGPGIDRGGINWSGVCYRVMGTKLVSIDSAGTVTTLGDVGAPTVGYSDQCTLDYSFTQLAIASGGRLYYWNGATLTQVTDPDLGYVIDFIWIDGYFMFTDGENIGVTELNNPLAVDPFKYGSSEVDPDPVNGLLKLQNEAYALNRNTIEVFNNIGGDVFPFQRIDGAQIEKGSVGTHTACTFGEVMAFMGGGRNEAIGVYLGQHSQATKISTREIDIILQEFTEEQLSLCVVEEKVDKAHRTLLIHLPDRTLAYDFSASQVLQTPVWYVLTTAIVGFSQYRARNLVRCYDRWLVGDPESFSVGYLDENLSTHYGESVRWEFGTTIIYNDGLGAIFHQLELVALPGRVPLGVDPTISTSYSVDGETWSVPRFISAGKQGQRTKRLVWFQQGPMGNWRVQRFQGDSDAHLAFARLEAQLEPLAVGF